jgi:DNA-binding CsgD family transcriptional regulator
MERINRRAQAAEASRLVALREGNTSLSRVMAREVASLPLGRLATAGGTSDKLVTLRPRDELDAVEPRRRGPVRLAPRSDALVRRGRRRDVRPRVLSPAEASVTLLGLAPEAARQAGVRASDLLDLCRAFGEALGQLEELARALAALPPPAMPSAAASGAVRADDTQDMAPAADAGFPDGLTRREVEVLLLVAEGRTSKEIAAELCVAVPTVSRHLANIYAKIGARSRADATRYALERLPGVLVARQESRPG